MGIRRATAVIAAASAVATVLVSCSSAETGDSPAFTELQQSSSAPTGEDAAGSGAPDNVTRLEDQPAASAMVSGGGITVTPVEGTEKVAYRLGTVDTSTYSDEGLSWISDDEGRVDGAASSSGSGRTVVFFIDGVQVPQTVAVARISGITRVDAVTVEVTYTIKSSGADAGHGNVVRFSVDDGKLSVGDTGEMGSALLWNTDIPYEATGQDGSRGNGPQPTTAGSGGTEDPSTGRNGIDTLSTVEPTGTVDGESFVSMETADGTEIRCRAVNVAQCSTRQPYWEVDGQKVNYVDLKTGEGNVSDLGQGWSAPATEIRAGEKYELEESIMGMAGLGYIGWDGTNVIRGPMSPYNTYEVLTPTGVVSVPVED